MKKLLRWLPQILTAIAAAWFLGTLAPPQDSTFAFNAFGKLPVVFNGRLKPMDSLARNSLLEIREKQTLNTEPWKGWNEEPKIISANEWLINVMMNSAVADAWPVFRVDNPDLIAHAQTPGGQRRAASGRQTLFLEPDRALVRFDQQGKRTRPENRVGDAQRLRAGRQPSSSKN